MSDFVRTVAVTGIVGALAAGTLALPSFLPPAMADQQPMKTLMAGASDLLPQLFDPDDLVKYDVTLDDSVSTEVLSKQVVRKIGYGNSKLVTIVHTASGTYSSDAITSPHVKYPGIEVERVPDWLAFLRGDHDGISSFSLHGNTVISGSFVLLLRPGE